MLPGPMPSARVRSFRQWRHVHALLHAMEADQLEVVGRLRVSTASRILENTESIYHSPHVPAVDSAWQQGLEERID